MYRRQLCFALVLASLVGLAACASSLPSSVDVRPVQPSSAAGALVDDASYQSAVTAIGDRDYGRALDYLQLARSEKGDDVRVLNAFGVVYDKLGRFDLSTRYYSQAEALDPNSPVVLKNIAYSETLRRMANYQGPQPALAAIAKPSLVADAQPDPVKREDVTATPELTPAVASEPATAMGVDPQKIAAALVPPASDMMLRADPAKIEESALTILTARVADLPTVATPVSVRTDPPSVGNAAAARPMMVAKVADVSTIATPAVMRSGPPSARIARPTMVAKVVMKTRALPIRPSGKKYVLVGYPLTVLNGSGQAVATERMRLLLARHGWARPRFDTFVQPIRRDTMLVYSESNFIPALALARTLRMPIHLVSCGRRCNRLQLVVGSDFLKSSLADAAHGLRRS